MPPSDEDVKKLAAALWESEGRPPCGEAAFRSRARVSLIQRGRSNCVRQGTYSQAARLEAYIEDLVSLNITQIV